VTLQTVATAVGVSRMTVSNAFSRPDQLSAELRRTILAAAEDLGYVGPDPAARALARGTTGAVGVLLTESIGTAFSDPVSATFLGALAERLGPTGLALALLPSARVEPEPVPARDVPVPARDVPMDGALVYSCLGDTPALGWLQRRRMPLVFVDQRPVGEAASVLMDDRGGARAAAEHLLALGHRRFGLVALDLVEPPGEVADPAGAPWGHVTGERVLGWLQPLAAAGVVPRTVRVAADTEQAAAAAVRDLLRGPDRPTALLCFSDVVAWGAVWSARDLGLRVPQDLSVVGFDDSWLAKLVSPTLTTVRQDLVAKGRRAADVLVAEIERRRSGSRTPAVHVVLPTELVVRQSTGPVPEP